MMKGFLPMRPISYHAIRASISNVFCIACDTALMSRVASAISFPAHISVITRYHQLRSSFRYTVNALPSVNISIFMRKPVVVS